MRKPIPWPPSRARGSSGKLELERSSRTQLTREKEQGPYSDENFQNCGHPGGWHRKRSGTGRIARARSGWTPFRAEILVQEFRLELRDLPQNRENDARRRALAASPLRRDLSRRSRLSRRRRSHFPLGAPDSDSAQFSAVREFAPGAFAEGNPISAQKC